MDAAPSAGVDATWRDSARSVLGALLLAAAIAGVPAIGSAQERAPAPARGEAQALARPWQADARATPDAGVSHSGTAPASQPTARTSTPPVPARHRDADALGAPDRVPSREEPVALDLAIATHAPVSLGAEANLRMPLGFLLRAHFGFMPEPYVGLINDVATGLGAYDESVASLVDRSGGNAFVMRLSGGIRPVPGYGFEILAGYTMIAASTRVSVRELEEATGQTMPGMDTVGISATLHALHVELGWSALVWDHLVIRGSIGWMHTLEAESRLDIAPELRRRSGGRIDAIEADVRDALTSYGFTPEIRVAVGYQF